MQVTMCKKTKSGAAMVTVAPKKKREENIGHDLWISNMLWRKWWGLQEREIKRHKDISRIKNDIVGYVLHSPN